MEIQRFEKGSRMSQAVVCGDLVFLAGQVAMDAPGQSVEAQTRDILQRIERLLATAGSGKSKLLQATIWLADIRSFEEMNAVWDAWIDPDNPPARACVEARLARPQYDVEIGIVATR